MNTNTINLEILLKESIFGLCIMGAVAIFNIYSFAWISLTYGRVLREGRYHGKHYEMFRYVAFILLLVIAMLVSLSIWVLALTSFNFVSDWAPALLFAASYFTSVGNFTVDLPMGWRLIPSIIAFSGLFGFAWATASSIGMAHNLSLHLEKHQ